MPIRSHTSHKLQWTKLVLLLGANLTLMSGASLSPAMPAMRAEFGSQAGDLFWISMIITLPALFVVLGGPAAGYLVDRVGRKPVLLAAILLGGFGGSAGFFLDAISLILVTRALVGISIAGAVTATNALIADYFQGQERSNFMGIQAAFAGLGGVIFLPLGGFLADINWRLTFLTYLPLIVLFPLALAFIKEPSSPIPTDISKPNTGMVMTPGLRYIFGGIFITSVTFMTIPIYIAYFMTDLLGVGGFEIGLAGAFSGVFSFLAGFVYGRISQRIRVRKIAILGYFLFTVGFLILGLGRTWLTVIAGQIILGFCLGLTGSNLTNWLSNEVDQSVRGRANGIYVTLMFLGNFLASFFYTPIIESTSYGFAYVLSGVMMGLIGVAGFFVFE